MMIPICPTVTGCGTARARIGKNAMNTAVRNEAINWKKRGEAIPRTLKICISGTGCRIEPDNGGRNKQITNEMAVSYTHLTLPTKRIV